MPFDAAPSPETTTRDRLIRLRDIFTTLDPTQFAMHEWECGTTACIGGWIDRVWPSPPGDARSLEAAGELLGLDGSASWSLFIGAGGLDYDDITPTTIVAVLDHLLLTGKVDWAVA